MRSTRALFLALAMMLPAAALTATPAKAGAAVSLSFFYDSLAPYGEWLVSAEFGYVWRPANVYVGWRPYVDGRWVHTDLGWTFVAYESWGWGPYHYGRWYLDPHYGWVWVPGYEWAPAWVTFYEGPGWIGWAPLPPRVSWTVVVSRPVVIDPRGYCFVETRHFLDPQVSRRIQPVSRNVTLLESTRHVSRFQRVGGAVVNSGLAVDRIERATRSRVRTFRLADQTDLRRAPRTELRGDRLEVFRPRIESRATRPPKVKAGRPARMEARPERSSGPAVERRPERVERREAPPRSSAPRVERSSSTSRPERAGPAPRLERKSAAPARKSAASESTRKVTLPDRRPAARPQKTSEARSRREAVAPRTKASASAERGDRRQLRPTAPAPTARSSRPSDGSGKQATMESQSRQETKPATRKRSDTARDRGGKRADSRPPADRKPPHPG